MSQSNNLLSLFVGNKANKLANTYHYFESEQIYAQQDPVDHSALFKDLQNHVPRSLHFGFNEDLDALQYHNYSVIKEEKKKIEQIFSNENLKQIDQSAWNLQQNLLDEKILGQQLGQIKMELPQPQPDSSQSEKIVNPYFRQLRTCLPEKKQLVQINRNYEEDFDTFTSGEMYYFDKASQREAYENILSKQLEEIDRLSGIQMFVDTDCGFGSFGTKLLQILEDECAKIQVITFALKNAGQGNQAANTYSQTIQSLNDMFTMTALRELTDICVPVDLRQISHFKFFNQRELQASEFNTFNGLAPFISNVTLPYRLKETQGMYDIVGRIVPFKTNNLFTIASDLPLIQPDGTLLDQDMNILYCADRIQKYPSFWKTLIDLKGPKIYGQSFMLRGLTDLPKKQPFSKFFDLKCLDTIYMVPSEYPKLFSDKVVKHYGVAETVEKKDAAKQEQVIKKLVAFPFHTCLLNTESFKYTILNIKNLYETGETMKASQRFSKDGVQDLDIKDLESKIMELYDSYEYQDEP